MSSPIALYKKNVIKGFLVKTHQILSHNHRVEVLANIISSYITELLPNSKLLKCIDVGCGDMRISEKIQEINPMTEWTCMDIYDLPEKLRFTDKWTKYRKFDGRNISFPDKSFDILLLCDVLHHVLNHPNEILHECSRVGKIVIIKDHFEYTHYSRVMLKIMDIFGNWGYGIKIPKRYMTIESFNNLCHSLNLKILKINIGIDLYSHLILLKWLLRPKWHFIAAVKLCSNS